MNINENPMYNYVAPNPWRNNALLAVNNLLNPPVNIIPPIVILSTEEKNVKRMQLKAALNEAASGLVLEIDLIDQPSIRYAMNEFVSKSHSKRLHICAICHERWFQDNTIIMNNNQYYCNRCLKDDKSNHTPDYQGLGLKVISYQGFTSLFFGQRRKRTWFNLCCFFKNFGH